MTLYDWPTSMPEAQGVDSDSLIRLLDYVQSEAVYLHSLLVVRHGHLILEAYRHPYHRESRHDVRSMAKSVTALLIGTVLNAGLSLDQPVLSFFPDRTITNRDARKAAITVRHLLTMTSGLALTDADTIHCLTDADALQWILEAPMTADPGTEFAYCSSNYYLLSAILQQVTDQSLAAYAQARLFDPLGIDKVRWQGSQQDITFGWGGLWLTSRALAQIGQMVLAGGQWAGNRIMPDSWVTTITRVQVPVANYGFGWWIEPERGAFMMSGYGGQFVYIMPEHDLIVVMIAGLSDPMPVLHHLIDTFICPADVALPENAAVFAALNERIGILERPQPSPIPPLPDTAQAVSGQHWRLGENGLGLTGLVLTFEDDTATLTLESGEDTALLPLGLDGVLREALVERLGNIANHDLMAASGAWPDDHRLIMHWYAVNNPEYWRVEMVFEDGRASLRWEDMISGYGETVAVHPEAE